MLGEHLYVCSVAQLCLAFCDPMDYSLPDSSVPGILQARIMEHVAISPSRRSSRHSGWTHVSCISCIGRWVLYHCAYLGCPWEIFDTYKVRDYEASVESNGVCNYLKGSLPCFKHFVSDTIVYFSDTLGI